MNPFVGAVLAVRFAVEIAALVALGYWGFETADGVLGVALGVGAAFLAAVAWGTFVSPKASVKLPGPLRLAVELAIFAAAAIALAAAGQDGLAVAFAAVAAAQIVLMYALRGYERERQS
ncbi:MAG TPA: YrdB family protein [Gaiellaceae bacterium]|nr:YrdB family protein [Gaiellaceae bacterium]